MATEVHGDAGIGSSTAEESVRRVRKGREKEDTGSSSGTCKRPER
jgi:hypothetical protein